jgi:hypothetical protein
MLAHLAAKVVLRDGERLCATSCPRGGRTDGRVERDVPVAAPGDPRSRVLPAAQGNERPVAPADRASLEAVGWPRPVEHASCVDLELRDAGRALQLV